MHYPASPALPTRGTDLGGQPSDPPNDGPPQPQSRAALTRPDLSSHKAVGDVSQVDSDDTPTTPKTGSFDFAQASTPSDAKSDATLSFRKNEETGSWVTRHPPDIGVPTISVHDSEASSLMDTPLQSQSDLSSSDGTSSDVSPSANVTSPASSQTSLSPSHSVSGRDVDDTPIRLSFFGPTPAERQILEDAGSHKRIEEDNSSLINRVESPGKTCDGQSLQIQQDGIRGVGADNIQIPPQSGSRAGSVDVITDAGDQDYKLHKRSSDPVRGSTHASHSVEDETRAGKARRKDEEPDLSNEIFKAFVSAHLPSTAPGFLPKEQLDRLINEKSIIRQLKKCGLSQNLSRKQMEEYAEKVCKMEEMKVSHPGKAPETRFKEFRKIFALLVLVGMSASIQKFLEDDVSDLDLPLIIVGEGALVTDLRRRDASERPSKVPLECFSGWAPMAFRNFADYQWSMLAPYFSQGKYNDPKHYFLKKQHILPFISPKDEGSNSDQGGGFGRVFMVRIHPENHNFHDPTMCDRGFAIKELQESDPVLFKREVDILKKFMGENSHPHVVSLLATYQQFDRYYLIFHRAEGNLFKYWEDMNPEPAVGHSSVLWMAEQCAGITQGLLKLHKHETFPLAHSAPQQKDEEPKQQPGNNARKQPKVRGMEPGGVQSSGQEKTRRLRTGEPMRQYGRHGDLKPENILCYRDSQGQYTLKICDFGAAEINSRMSKSKVLSQVANTMTYRPPECDLKPNMIRQSFDIWSLGCVFMEFVAWALGGATLWDSFSPIRRYPDPFIGKDTDAFFEIVKNEETGEPGATVNPAVTKFFNELHSHPNCTDYFHTFLDIIKNNMLVVQAERRICCEKLSKQLEDALQKCRDDSDYATKKNPWNPERQNTKPLTESVEGGMSDQVKKEIKKKIDKLRVHRGRVVNEAAPRQGYELFVDESGPRE